MAKIRKWHDKHEFLIWIVLAVCLLRIPSLFEPYWYGDEGIYLVLGQALKKGLVWYRDIHDNKPPLLYLVAAIGGNLMWLRMILLFWNALNVFLFGKLAEKIVKNSWLVCGATLGFGLLTTLPWLEGNVANGEVFMIMPVTAAALLLLMKVKEGLVVKKYLGVGLLLAIGFLFKVPVAFDVVAIVFWLLVMQTKETSKWKEVVLMGVGFGVPVALTVVYYWLVGAGGAYIVAAFLQNVSYLSSWRGGDIVSSGTGNQGLMMRGIIAAVATAGVWWLTRGEKKEKRLAPVWLIWALFGAVLSERPYPHYLLQVVAPTTLVLAGMFEGKRLVPKVMAGGLVGLVVATGFYFKFSLYSTAKYYGNYWQMVTKKISVVDYYRRFDGRAIQTYSVAKYLKMHTQESDTIFIWGDEPYIYALAERLPPGRFTVAYHVADFGGREETIKAIREREPKYIVIMEDEKRDFDELISLVTSSYTLVEKIERANIYRLVEQ